MLHLFHLSLYHLNCVCTLRLNLSYCVSIDVNYLVIHYLCQSSEWSNRSRDVTLTKATETDIDCIASDVRFFILLASAQSFVNLSSPKQHPLQGSEREFSFSPVVCVWVLGTFLSLILSSVKITLASLLTECVEAEESN